MEFIPDLRQPDQTVVFFEDSSRLEIPGRSTTKSISALQKEITKVLIELGAFGIFFTAGTYAGTPKRYGFAIYFKYANTTGRIDVAALPLRRETPAKKEGALTQALYLIRDKFQAQRNAMYYEPKGMPLMPYLIGATGQTVTEALVATGNLPLLGSGA